MISSERNILSKHFRRYKSYCLFIQLKGALSGLKQCLATEILLKMKKNAFYFTLKALFVFNIFNFLS